MRRVVLAVAAGLLLPFGASAADCSIGFVGSGTQIAKLGCNAGAQYVIMTEFDPSHLDNYSCTTRTESGPNHAFEFECGGYSGPVVVNMWQTWCDFDLAILTDTCEPNDCVSIDDQGYPPVGGQEETEFYCLPGEKYYVIVEGYALRNSSSMQSCVFFNGSFFGSYYWVDAACIEDCYDGIDNDGDGFADCDDNECPSCVEICTDGFDNDGDGLADCQDLDCPACNEDCFDLIDNDFDLLTDCSDPDCNTEPECCDKDMDGWWSNSVACGSGADCNDSPANGFAINPGRTDIPADGIDQDCDFVDDCYQDLDHDGFGTSTAFPGDDRNCNNTPGESDRADDCDDTSAWADTVHPGAVEYPGDGIDQDCDLFDDCYQDLDGDGYGSAVPVNGDDMSCNGPNESALSSDCDDNGPNAGSIHPGAVEAIGNGVDENCDGHDSCWQDLDGDGYGSSATITAAGATCDAGIGEATTTGDCNDVGATASGVYPGAAETAVDGVDQDCDGADHCFQDLDGDSYGSTLPIAGDNMICGDAPGESASNADCDDTGPNAADIYPSAPEIPADGVDQDCDTFDDCYQDLDLDGWGSSVVIAGSAAACGTVNGEVTQTGDCDDITAAAASIYPNAPEIAVDGVDQNCDQADHCFQDLDGDSFGSTIEIPGDDMVCGNLLGESASNADCNDNGPNAAASYPGAPDAPSDGVDQNCDLSDNCYQDLDGDGVGSSISIASTSMICGIIPGESAITGDCDDTSPIAATVYPGAAETPADNIDQDCDSTDACYQDLDGDGYGTNIAIAGDDLFCGNVAGESLTNDDCVDQGAGAIDIHPNADEVCDNIDNDCDFEIDDQDADLSDPTTWYLDFDGDQFGTINSVTEGCDQPLGYVRVAGDCADDRPLIHPAAGEVCDGEDNDCDNFIDEDDPDIVDLLVWYTDQDGDGWGDDTSTLPVETCDLPDGYAALPGDCDDHAQDIWPGAPEVPYDGVDQDCANGDLVDVDEDGFVAWHQGGQDCYDINVLIYPGAPESRNGMDDDCDGTVDEGTDGYDDDGDGHTERGGDCDDTDPTVHPSRTEICDGVDQNCNLLIDDGTECFDDDHDGYSEAAGDCNDGDINVSPGRPELPHNGFDDNCDGVIDLGLLDGDHDGYAVAGGDCLDNDATVYPGAPEIIDTKDNDCDSLIDEGTAVYDDDGDGISESWGDCDDTDPLVNPNAPEVSNGYDDDCDGVIDEDGLHVDDDGDGFSDWEGDCDDTRADIAPGHPERENGLDDDCDGDIDEDFSDVDQDGYTIAEGDCNDVNGWASPDAQEVCDSIDNDCDGAIDEGCEGFEATDVETSTDDTPRSCSTTPVAPQRMAWLLGVVLIVAIRRRRPASPAALR